MTKRRRTGLVMATGVALVARLASVAAVFSITCWAGTQVARSSDQGAGLPGTKGAPGMEPEFRPGISGLKMADVRAYKQLWREIEELQGWERGDRIPIAEYRNKVIEKTAQFLGLGAAAAHEFAAVASDAVAAIRESFLRRRRADGYTTALEDQFYSDMRGAVTRLTSFLKKEPRHQLFAPECKKWLLRLAFGPSEAKEAREAKQARVDKPGELR